MLNEFKTFIARGNVIDMAVGIVVGAAFTAIVTSLVSDVINPFIGMLMGGLDFSTYYVDLSMGGYATLEQAKASGAPLVMYGLFINAVIKFLIVAFVVFILVKQINRLKAAPPASKDAPPAPEDIQLLREIRDALKTKPSKSVAAVTAGLAVKSAPRKTGKKKPVVKAAASRTMVVKAPAKKKAAAKKKPAAKAAVSRSMTVKAPAKKKPAAKRKVAKKPAAKAAIAKPMATKSTARKAPAKRKAAARKKK